MSFRFCRVQLYMMPNVSSRQKCEVRRGPLYRRHRRKSGRRVFVDTEVIRGGPLLEVAAHGREARAAPRYPAVAVSSTSSPRAIRGRCYCVRNLYATIRATMLAKISSAGMDFRIIGIVEWRATDRLRSGLGPLWSRLTLPSAVGVRAFGSGAAPTPLISL